jgi:signal transduction histidine kinase
VPETQLILSYLLSILALLTLGGLALFSMAHAKDRIIREQRKALEAEQRLRRAQEAFTDNAHHELKTPLQIISGHLHILRQLDPRPEQTEILVRAESATRRLQDLVQDLLDFTALHQGSLVIRPELMDLEPHLKGLVADYGARAAARGLQFHAEGDPLPAPVACDGPRLRRALAALLDNALKFTATGTIQVRWTARRDQGHCLLRFEVADTGHGLPPDWPRLLLPFEQGVAHPHRIQEGLGLGLPLAAGLLRAMGGRMGLTPLPAGALAWAELDLPEQAPG